VRFFFRMRPPELGCGVQVGLRVHGVANLVQDLEFRVSVLEIRFSGFGFRVSSFGFRVSG